MRKNFTEVIVENIYFTMEKGEHLHAIQGVVSMYCGLR